MKYLLLLYGDAGAEADLGAAGRQAIVEDHARFGRVLDRDHAMVVSEALGDASGARTLRFPASGGEPTVTDGPFLETKEVLGGFYVLECETQDQAIELATQVPRSPGLVAELRPIVDM